MSEQSNSFDEAGKPEYRAYPEDIPSAGPAAMDLTGTVDIPGDLAIPVETAAIGSDTKLAQLTTMRVGGGAERFLIAESATQLADHARELWETDEPWLLLGGGSNTVVCDEGFPGTVLLVRNSGIEIIADETLPAGSVRVRAEAGQDWDELVAWTVENGYSGIEMLSGIPGLAGAAPVQNIGAYGGELSQVLHSITVYERDSDSVRELAAAELELSYRDSIFKHGYEAVVLAIDLVLQHGTPADGGQAAAELSGSAPEKQAKSELLGQPIAYAQLAAALDVKLGARVPLQRVRNTVLSVRAEKGMVLNPADHDSWSSGSFFTNPIVSAKFARTLPFDAPQFPVDPDPARDTVTTFEELYNGVEIALPTPGAQRTEPRIKLSAAWLIEHAGVRKGLRLGGSGAAISSKHTLAITNRGGATAADVAELARYVINLVQTEFGVLLTPEPNLYGLEL